MSQPLIYAELLPNISQISVIITLDTPCNASTRAAVSAKENNFTLEHDGCSYILDLPGRINIAGRLPILDTSSHELTWRLPTVIQAQRIEDDADKSGLISARTLNGRPYIICRQCTAVLAKDIVGWKDLPSEDWAEMMEFWHCHKPSDHNFGQNESSGNITRGYGASMKISAIEKMGFVGVSDLLMASSDCTGVEASAIPTEAVDYVPLACKFCHGYVGNVDKYDRGYHLYKWRVGIHDRWPLLDESKHLCYNSSITSTIAAQILSIKASHCSSRLAVLPLNGMALPDDITISIWILSPALMYATTGSLGASPTGPKEPPILRWRSGIKIFWKLISTASANELIDKSVAEELLLPAEAISELGACLELSSKLLPPSSRSFQGWNVGLLDQL